MARLGDYFDTFGDQLLHWLGDTARVTITTGNGQSIAVDAIIGRIRIDEEPEVNGEVERLVKVERMTLTFKRDDLTNGGFSVMAQTELQHQLQISVDGGKKWTVENIESAHQHFVRVACMRKPIKKYRRVGLER